LAYCLSVCLCRNLSGFHCLLVRTPIIRPRYTTSASVCPTAAVVTIMTMACIYRQHENAYTCNQTRALLFIYSFLDRGSSKRGAFKSLPLCHPNALLLLLLLLLPAGKVQNADRIIFCAWLRLRRDRTQSCRRMFLLEIINKCLTSIIFSNHRQYRLHY